MSKRHQNMKSRQVPTVLSRHHQASFMEEKLDPLSSACPSHLNSNQFLSSIILVLRHTKVTLPTSCFRPTQCLPGPVLSHLWKPALPPLLGPLQEIPADPKPNLHHAVPLWASHSKALCSGAKQLLPKLWHLLHSFCPLPHHTVLYLAVPNDQL